MTAAGESRANGMHADGGMKHDGMAMGVSG